MRIELWIYEKLDPTMFEICALDTQAVNSRVEISAVRKIGESLLALIYNREAHPISWCMIAHFSLKNLIEYQLHEAFVP